MALVRRPSVAGMFYPRDPQALASSVQSYLAEAAKPAAAETKPPAALIVPHAGHVYSGPIAASAYARLAPLKGKIERVVLIGPGHRMAFKGLAVSDADVFETPLGRIPVDRAAIETLLRLPQVKRLENAYDGEHSLEVHLPFLQEVLGSFRLVPLIAGDARAEEVAEVLELLWQGPETLPVMSSDLSHYHDYETARRRDAATARAIEALDGAKLGWDDACGRVPVSGLLAVAKKRGLTATTLDLRNSGDTKGPRDRVVGYGSWMVA